MAARSRTNDFEKSFQQLEQIVRRLESEELPLDESLGLFEEAEVEDEDDDGDHHTDSE